MEHGPEGNIDDGKTVPRDDIHIRPGSDLISHLQSRRSKNIALLSVHVMETGKVRASIGIVLDRGYPCWNPILVALEINDPVTPLMATTSATHRDLP
tara:strand:+ start:233 stop:523 length:291 start_codon:yes stop_codon:yes gene_type:complete